MCGDFFFMRGIRYGMVTSCKQASTSVSLFASVVN